MTVSTRERVQSVYLGDGRFETRTVATTPPPPGQVAIAVAYTGLCGTDLHIFHGHMDQRVTIPAVIGHEMSGTVAAVGPGVDGLAPGDPVTVMPLDMCGSCPACRAGHRHVCHRMRFLGIDAEGSMQQVWTVAADAVIPLPPGLALEAAALVEPTAVAVHDVRRAEVRPGEHVVVVGGGPVGILIAVVAREAGAEVVLLEVDEGRREVAASLGLRVLDPGDQDVAAWVDRWTGEAGADVAFEVSGSAPGVATAVAVLATRGRLCMVAIHPTPREVDLHRFFWRELTMVGARLYRRADFDRAVELVAAGVVPVAALVTRTVRLDAVAEAFGALSAGGGAMKILVDCTGGAR